MSMVENTLTPKQIRGMCELSQDEMALKVGLSRDHYVRIENDSSMFRKSKIEVSLNLLENIREIEKQNR